MVVKFTHKQTNDKITLDTTHSERTKTVNITGDDILASIFDEELNRQLNPGTREFVPEELKPYLTENGHLMKYKDGYIKNIFIPTYANLYNIEILNE